MGPIYRFYGAIRDKMVGNQANQEKDLVKCYIKNGRVDFKSLFLAEDDARQLTQDQKIKKQVEGFKHLKIEQIFPVLSNDDKSGAIFFRVLGRDQGGVPPEIKCSPQVAIVISKMATFMAEARKEVRETMEKSFFDNMLALKEEDRERIFSALYKIISKSQKYINIDNPWSYYHEIVSMPEANRNEKLLFLESLIDSYGHSRNIIDVLVNLQCYSLEENRSIFEMTKTLMIGLKLKSSFNPFIMYDLLGKMPREIRQKTVDFLLLHNKMIRDENIFDLLSGLNDSRYDEDLVISCEEAINNSQENIEFKGSDFLLMMRALSKVPKNERKSVLTLTKFIIDDNRNALLLRRGLLGDIINMLVGIPAEERAEIALWIQKLIKLGGGTESISALLPYIIILKMAASREDFTNFMHRLAKLIQSSQPKGVTDSKISEALRKDPMSKLFKLFGPLDVWVKFLKQFPLEKSKKIVLEITKNIASSDQPQYQLYYDPEPFYNLFYLFSFDTAVSYIGPFYAAYKVGSPQSKFIISLLQNPDIQKQAVAHLLELLNSGEVSPETKLKIAEIIENIFHQKLLFSEDDILIQEAYAAMALYSKEALKDPKNPFTVYKKLKEALNEPFIDVNVSSHSIPVDGKNVDIKLNLAKLRAEGGFQGFTVDDLPKEVKKETLQELFSALKARIAAIQDGEEKEKVNKEIVTDYKKTLEELEANLISKPFITELLNSKPKENGTIRPSLLELYCVLSYFLSESDQLQKRESLLTPRERVLLAFSREIDLCEQGQAEGLATYYNYTIPEKYKKALPSGVSKDKSIAVVEVEAAVQKAMFEMFRSQALLNLVIPKIEQYYDAEKKLYVIPQEVHQVQYLVNRFSRQLGYKAPLLFDKHTGQLCISILNAPLKETLEKMVNNIDAQSIIKALTSRGNVIFKSDKKEDKTLTNEMIALIDKGLPKGIKKEDVILYDEDTYEFKEFKVMAAVALLLGSNYFTLHEASASDAADAASA